MLLIERVDINPVDDSVHGSVGAVRAMFDDILATWRQLLFVHPNQHCLKGIGDGGAGFRVNNGISTRSIDFIVERQGDASSG